MKLEFTERQEISLEIKEHHKIYFENPSVDIDELLKRNVIEENDVEYYKSTRYIADLDEVDVLSVDGLPKNENFRAYLPDYTPSWLYKILILFNANEVSESCFSFYSKKDEDEFKRICDMVNE